MSWAGGRRLRAGGRHHLDSARWRVRRHGWHLGGRTTRDRTRRASPGSPPGIQIGSGQAEIGISSGNSVRAYQTKRRGLAVPWRRPHWSRFANPGGIQRRRVCAPERSADSRHASWVLHATEPIFEPAHGASRLGRRATSRLKYSSGEGYFRRNLEFTPPRVCLACGRGIVP